MTTTSAKGRYGMGNLCEHRQISANCDRCAVISLVKMNADLHKRIADAADRHNLLIRERDESRARAERRWWLCEQLLIQERDEARAALAAETTKETP